MFNTKLIVKTYPNSTTLDLKDTIPLSVNFSIADIRQPDKRTGAFSKTITLYGTKTNNQFFEHLYEVNIKTLNFNPNIKTQASILQDDVEVLRGDLQLQEVRKKWQNGTEMIEYDCSIFGNTSSIFTTISDSKLEDLDLSTYNHTYNMADQQNSWATSIKIANVVTPFALGVGYVYPLIDYGETQTQSGNSWDVQNMRPAIYAKTYLDKIFSVAGKSYTSTFLNSTRFKSLIIPHNGDVLSNSAATLATKEFYAGRLSTSGTGTHALGLNGSNWQSVNSIFNFLTHFGLQPNDDSTTPFNDAGGVYSTIGGIYTSNTQGFVSLNASIKIQAKLNAPAGTVSITGSFTGAMCWSLLKKASGSSTWTYAGGNTVQNPFGNNTLSTSYQTGTININLSWIPMIPGDQFRFVYEICPSSTTYYITFLDGGSLPITTGSASIDVQELAGAYISGNLSTKQVLDGNPLVMNDAIPKDVKQRDFIMWLVKMFNLYIDIDKTNTDNYLIEPRETFYGSTVIDWTLKLAADSDITIKPMGELNGKTYIWQYKSDSDYYNKLYNDEYSTPYGTKTQIIVNDFLKNEYKTEVGFSATPISNYPPSGNNLIIPRIFSFNGSNIKPTKHNVRILYYGGVKSSGGTWNYTSSNNSLPQTTHPYAGMSDDPLTTLFTLEFGVLNKLYYYDPSTVYTDNNLYNAFYSRMINEITDRDSKIVVMYLKLDPIDILKFDFRNLIFIQDSYYVVNKIIDYNPVNESLTKVELLKITTYPTFSPVFVPPAEMEADAGGTGEAGMQQQSGGQSAGGGEGNSGMANNQMAGTMINSMSQGGVYTGSNISVSSDSYNINIVSCDSVFVASGATGFTAINTVSAMVAGNTNNNTLIGCNGIEIRTGVNNFTGMYIQNRVVTSADNGKVEIGGSVSLNNAKYASIIVITDPPGGTPVTTAYTTYYGNCNTGNQNYTLPSASLNKDAVFYFVKTDPSVNTMTISGTEPINGAASLVISTQYQSYTLQSDGTNWHII